MALSDPPATGSGHLTEVELHPMPLSRFDDVLSPAGVERLHRALAQAREIFAGRTVWNVNSTARGGGVAELLTALLPYAQDAGVGARWLVNHGTPDFFAVTKRLHNRLHGAAGDGGNLGREERAVYEAAVLPAAAELAARVKPGDVVILHDPQTAGMVPTLHEAGVRVVWRVHIGIDLPGELARSGWAFLLPYVQHADLVVFSRESFAWDVLPSEKLRFISPSIDPFASKNEALGDAAVAGILSAAGLREAGRDAGPPVFSRHDGSRGEVRAVAEVDRAAPLGATDRYVLQVSRWDLLKDPIGVMEGFARHIAPRTDAHLVYAGPAVDAVADDPEGAQVLDRARAHRRQLPPEVRDRIHLAMLPMDDPDENAATVNALQRGAAVVVQKSLAEGFGLTVSEAMWKGRPVVASALGGIGDQIEDGRSGVLLADPRDGRAFGDAVVALLDDPARAEALGRAAHERVRDHFLSDRSLIDYLSVLQPLL